jgi:hypothetical protein
MFSGAVVVIVWLFWGEAEMLDGRLVGLWSFTPLSTIFQLCPGG